jgi:hypothetical protein
VLAQAGWPADQVRDALGTFAEVDFPLPVPRPKPQLSAHEAFLYLLLFVTLYVSAFSLGSLIFEFIARAYPDPAMDEVWSPENVRWSVSALIIGFPVFLFVSNRIQRALRADPTRTTSPVRKWLTYMAMLFAASVVIGDLVAVVFNALSGELTVRFVLKALTVGVITGSILIYYLAGLREEKREQ